MIRWRNEQARSFTAALLAVLIVRADICWLSSPRLLRPKDSYFSRVVQLMRVSIAASAFAPFDVVALC